MTSRWYVLNLNPEQWDLGTITGRKGGGSRISPNPNLVTFQNAVREELEDVKMLPAHYRRITFYFWREQAKYLDASDHIRQRNRADATNLQKGLEDALQGLLFANDREVRDIRSVVMEQGHGVKPRIVIRADTFDEAGSLKNLLDAMPEDVVQRVFLDSQDQKEDSKWEHAEELF